MAQNLIEKIAQRHAVGLEAGAEVHGGDYLSVRPAYVMTHDNTGAVIPKFRSIGAKKIKHPLQVVFTLDHNIQDRSEANLEKYEKIRQFAASMQVDFYPAGRGIGHQIMCEEGYVWPGTFVVASDSHSNMYGGLGCLGTPVVRTDAAAIWATGLTWWQVPPVARVELNGSLSGGVTGKDVIIALCGLFNRDEVLNHAIEFVGSGISHLTVDQRLTIANMTTEWGALAGVFPIDETTVSWLRARAGFVSKRGPEGVASDSKSGGAHPRLNEARIKELEVALKSGKLSSDPEAFYEADLLLDLGSVQPHVSGPNSVKVMTPVSELSRKKVRIDKAYLVSCVNSRLEDIAEAASVVTGKRIAAGVSFYVAAASSEVQKQSEEKGYWKTLTDAGAITLPPGCGPCIGLGTGLLEDGEVGISATNRNFKGRMGSKDAQAYLASPYVVAASALAGFITHPAVEDGGPPDGTITVREIPAKKKTRVSILDGFPETLRGEVLFCPQDNMNTDGIYPGKYTYVDDFTPEQQAGVVMENYDPEFGKIVKEGDILVGGFNFGTGSSREQAATALKYRGIRLVVAGSFSETYKRNALNNGFLVIDAPGFVRKLKEKFAPGKLTIRTGIELEIDFCGSRLSSSVGDYDIGPVGTAAQELVLSGGLEAWVGKRLGN